MKKITLDLLLIVLLTGCSTATPVPATVTLDAEFTLAPHQTATLTDSDLTIRLIGVAGDERCPSAIEFAASGPGSLSLSAQIDDSEPTDINLQVFTSNDGRVPDVRFEGIEDRVIHEG